MGEGLYKISPRASELWDHKTQTNAAQLPHSLTMDVLNGVIIHKDPLSMNLGSMSSILLRLVLMLKSDSNCFVIIVTGAFLSKFLVHHFRYRLPL
eukprot:scaffold65317_cov49-Cyclotella_meneghiniana.AAC.2